MSPWRTEKVDIIAYDFVGLDVKGGSMRYMDGQGREVACEVSVYEVLSCPASSLGGACADKRQRVWCFFCRKKILERVVQRMSTCHLRQYLRQKEEQPLTSVS